MPPRIPRACRYRGCANTTTDKSGFCEKHQGASWRAYSGGRSAAQRGYGPKWRALRKHVLRRDRGYCVMCKAEGRAVLATDIDHIIEKAHGGTDYMDNLQSLCREHHRKKTALAACQRRRGGGGEKGGAG